MNPNDPCVFCNPEEFVDEFEETLWIDREGPRVYKAVPLNPVVPGHVMFIPRTHVKNAAMNPFVTGAVFQEAAKHAAIFGPQFNLITSAGVDATQSIMHLHVHYVPRTAGDGLKLPWTEDILRARIVAMVDEFNTAIEPDGSASLAPVRDVANVLSDALDLSRTD